MEIYGLIGKSLTHSFSRKYFTEKFRKENIDAEYRNFELGSIDEFQDFRLKYKLASLTDEPEILGLNVTIPYKEKILDHLDGLNEDAEAIGAVNTLLPFQGQIWGYNTDHIGFARSLQNWFKPEIPVKALIIGTGGASKAVKYVLEHHPLIKEYTLLSRSGKGDNIVNYPVDKYLNVSEYKLIINTTPLGTSPGIDQCPDIPYHLLDESHYLYDLVYNPPLTKFLELGKKQGARIKNGQEMLELQAEAAWEIWQLRKIHGSL